MIGKNTGGECGRDQRQTVGGEYNAEPPGGPSRHFRRSQRERNRGSCASYVTDALSGPQEMKILPEVRPINASMLMNIQAGRPVVVR